ncbi:MAG: hypothetical protein ACLPHP_02885 [Candidatus Sulfotelmatobacter sp.]
MSVPDNGQRPLPLHIRLVVFVAVLTLWAVTLVTGAAFLFLIGMAVFFWAWEGWQFLPYALLALGVSIGAAWLSALLIRKIDRRSRATDRKG